MNKDCSFNLSWRNLKKVCDLTRVKMSLSLSKKVWLRTPSILKWLKLLRSLLIQVKRFNKGRPKLLRLLIKIFFKSAKDINKLFNYNFLDFNLWDLKTQLMTLTNVKRLLWEILSPSSLWMRATCKAKILLWKLFSHLNQLRIPQTWGLKSPLKKIFPPKIKRRRKRNLNIIWLIIIKINQWSLKIHPALSH